MTEVIQIKYSNSLNNQSCNPVKQAFERSQRSEYECPVPDLVMLPYSNKVVV